MIEKNFIERLRNNPRPVVVDFWAPWCAPCRAIGPVVEKLGEEYAGRVDLWKVNADEQPDLLRSLHIYGIPTLIAYHNGQEVGRRTGAASATVLSSLFKSALTGNKPERNGPELNDRFLRLGAGLALSGSGNPQRIVWGAPACWQAWERDHVHSRLRPLSDLPDDVNASERVVP